MAKRANEHPYIEIEKPASRSGQSLVETALVLPIVLFLVFGVFELGRVVFIFSAVNNASREAARFGAATGAVTGGAPRYLSCAAIRQVARETAFLSGLTDADVDIGYDTPQGNIMVGTYRCGDANLDASDITLGDRIVVTVTRTINPILPFLPSFQPTFVTARTILKDIVIGPVECSDGLDNDGDGLVDFGDPFIIGVNDDGCTSFDDTTEALCYRFTLFGEPTDGGNLSYNPTFNCANRYIEGTGVDLEAIAAERYIFDYWEWDGANQGTAPTNRVTMDADKDVIAHFRLLSSDLEVTKDAPPTVLSNQSLAYTISVRNPYTDTARNVVVTDTLPAGVTYLSSSAECTPPATPDGIVVCRAQELAAGPTPLSFTIEVRAPIAETNNPITLTNTVTASAFEYDPDPSNNTASVDTVVQPLARLSLIDKVDSRDPVDAGTTFDYTITVGNAGPSIATGVRITDTLPSGVTFVATDASCTPSGTTVLCPIGTLNVGQVVSRTFTVRAPANGATVTNTAIVRANEVDDNLADNSGSEQTLIESIAELTIEKTGPETATRDVPFSYLLRVNNGGPSTAIGVNVLDPMPAGMVLDGWSIVSGSGSCSRTGPNDQTLSCQFGSIGANATHEVAVNVTAQSDGLLTNTATLTSGTKLAAGSVVKAGASTMVSSDVTLRIVKSGPDEIMVGDSLVYTIVVYNDGASSARNVSVLDKLPDELGWPFSYNGDSPATGTGWLCQPPAGRDVVCTRDTIVGGTSASLEVVITPQTARLYENTATVTSEEVSAGVSDSHSTRVVADFLSLAVDAPATVNVSTPFSYTVTAINSLQYNAGAITVTSQLAEGVTYGSAVTTSGTGWTCGYDAANRRVVCNIDPMPPGTAVFTITVTAPTTPTSNSVEATVSGPRVQYDSNASNNTASQTVTVQ
jgi:uncharacterized repeat protein (TIGR01451 family)